MDKKRWVRIILLVLLSILIIFHSTAHALTYGIPFLKQVYAGAGALYIENSYYPLLINFQEFRIDFFQYEIISMGLILLEFIAILSIILHRKSKPAKVKSEPQDFSLEKRTEKNTSKSKTDLDALYSELKDKKRIKISSISKAFGISKELALEWAKILESGDLASIEYPNMSEPIIVLNESGKKEDN